MSASENQIVVYQPNETVRLDVRFDNDTVWMPQPQIAELFACSLENIRLHLKNIYASGELDKLATSKDPWKFVGRAIGVLLAVSPTTILMLSFR